MVGTHATSGNILEQESYNNVVLAHRGWGVTSGLATTGSNGLAVVVAVGTALVGTSPSVTVLSAQTQVVISTPDVTDPRFDLIIINASGVLSAVVGTAQSNAETPDYDFETNNAILLAEVSVPANDTSIESGQIIDRRVFLAEPNLRSSPYDIITYSTWTYNKTAIRSVNTNYQNATGRIIFITMSGSTSDGSESGYEARIGPSESTVNTAGGRLKRSSSTTGGADARWHEVSFMVPPGWWYRVNQVGTMSLQEWWEF